MRTAPRLSPLLLAFALACGGEGTGPGINLSGNWLYSTTNVSGSGLSCSSGGTLLSVTHQGGSFSGTYSGGTITCNIGGVTESGPLGVGTVVSGSLAGTAVTFDLDTSDWRNSGTVSGNSMSGSLVVRLVVDNVTHTLTGNWGASRTQ